MPAPLYKRVPFLRYSFWRMLVGMPHLLKVWQVGDGREARLLSYVKRHAREGDLQDVIRAIDEYGYNESFLINVGDEKGRIVDAALHSVSASCVLELGTYCGYSALRMAQAAPEARIFSIEFNADNAAIARELWAYAGVDKRVTVIVGTLDDGGRTLRRLREEHGFSQGSLDFLFIDHDKSAYLPDLRRVLDEGWLRPGALVVADNVKFPGAPEYHAYMKRSEGRLWRTTEHETHVEYQSIIKDLVLVSEWLAP